MAGGTVEEVEVTGSAGTSKMIIYRLPYIYSLVPIDNQVTYIFCNIDDFQLYLDGWCFYLVIIISNIERETGLRHNGAGLKLWRGEQLNEAVEPHCCLGELLAVLLQQVPADRRRPQYIDGHSSYAG